MLNTNFFNKAEINPLPSATPTPSKATNTVPSGAKPVKFLIALVNMYLIPSGVNKLTTPTVNSCNSPDATSIPSYVTDTPSLYVI